MGDEFIRSTGYHLTFLVVVSLVLLYQVFYVQRNQLKALEVHHKESFSRLPCDGTGVFNPYATRNETITDSGLTNSNALVWGNEPGSLMKTTLGDSNSSTFLGGPEPPVFYDIGDVREVRKTRTKASAGDFQNEDGYNKKVQRVASLVDAVDENGNKYKKLVYTDCLPGQIVYKNKCVTPESARFMPIDSFIPGDDDSLLAAAQGVKNSY